MSVPASSELLEHAGALRALARALVRGADDADELVQRTWLIALQRHPAGPIRAWLARVLHNEARQSWRAEQHRHRREHAAARPEAQASAAEVVCRLALQRRVVECVEALPAGEREAICLRYFDGLPPRAIAARLGVPARNVESRLRRALARLREALDRDRGRRAWLAGLAAIGWPARTAPWIVTAGAMLMHAKIVWTAAALTCLSLVALWALQRDPPHAAPVASAAGAPAPPPSRVTSEADGAARSAVAAPPEPAASASPSGPVVREVRGIVLGADALPRAGVSLGFVPARDAPAADVARPAVVQSGADGRFAIAAPLGRGQLRTDGAGWTTLIAAERTNPADASECVVVVAPSRRLAGVVVAAGEGAPIAGASVSVAPPAGLRARFPILLAASVNVEWSASTEDGGAFSFLDAPRLAGCRLRADAPGYAPADIEVPEHDDTELRITLRALAADVIRGVVLDTEGNALPGATVALDRKVTKSDATGAFEFVVAEAATAERLFAAAEGFLPAIAERRALPGGKWPDHVELRMPGAPLSIQGRVLDAEGRPHRRAEVWVNDPTIIGVHDSGVAASAEHVITPGELLWRQFATDDDGRFTIPGLLDRVYELRAIDRETLQFAHGQGRAGAAGVVLQFAPDGVAEELHGKVVDRHGRGIGDISLTPERVGFVYTAGPGTEGYACQERAMGTETDPDGGFRLQPLAREGIEIYLNGKGVIPRSFTVPAERGPSPVEIVMARPCQVRVDLSGSALADADAVELCDDRGERLEVRRETGDSTWIERRIKLVDGRGEVVTVSDAVATAVVLRGGAELTRLHVEPQPEGVTIVRP